MNKDVYRKEKSSVSKINIHLVFVSKYRKKVFTHESLLTMKSVMHRVARKMNFDILEIEAESDHVHLLIEIPPKLSVSQVVNSLKGVSSIMLRKKHLELRKYKSLWSPSYFAISCGGAPIEIIKQYIQNQSTPEGAGSNPRKPRSR